MEDAEPSRLVVCKSTGMVEVAGVNGDPGCTHVPGAPCRKRQKVSTKPLADKPGKQTEVRDLHVAHSLAFELEVVRRSSGTVRDPSFKIGAIQVGQPARAVPR